MAQTLVRFADVGHGQANAVMSALHDRARWTGAAPAHGAAGRGGGRGPSSLAAALAARAGVTRLREPAWPRSSSRLRRRRRRAPRARPHPAAGRPRGAARALRGSLVRRRDARRARRPHGRGRRAVRLRRGPLGRPLARGADGGRRRHRVGGHRRRGGRRRAGARRRRVGLRRHPRRRPRRRCRTALARALALAEAEPRRRGARAARAGRPRPRALAQPVRDRPVRASRSRRSSSCCSPPTPACAATRGSCAAAPARAPQRTSRPSPPPRAPPATQEVIECGAGIAAIAVDGDELQVRSYPSATAATSPRPAGSTCSGSTSPRTRRASPPRRSSCSPRPPARRARRRSSSTASSSALQLHESIGHALELDRMLLDEAAYAGTSWVAPAGPRRAALRLRRSCTSPPTRRCPAALGSFGWDDEGVAAQRTPLIVGGHPARARCRLAQSAATIGPGRAPAAAPRADGFARQPIVRMTNVSIEPGDAGTLADLIADTDDGLYLETNRSWSIDDRRLQFQFATEVAREIRGGELGRLLRNPSYAGVTPRFWGGLDAVCGPPSGSCGALHELRQGRAGPARCASRTAPRRRASATSRSASREPRDARSSSPERAPCAPPAATAQAPRSARALAAAALRPLARRRRPPPSTTRPSRSCACATATPASPRPTASTTTRSPRARRAARRGRRGRRRDAAARATTPGCPEPGAAPAPRRLRRRHRRARPRPRRAPRWPRRFAVRRGARRRGVRRLDCGRRDDGDRATLARPRGRRRRDRRRS